MRVSRRPVSFNEHLGSFPSVSSSFKWAFLFLTIVVTWSYQVQLDLTFREAVQGCSKVVNFQTAVRCQSCSESFLYPSCFLVIFLVCFSSLFLHRKKNLDDLVHTTSSVFKASWWLLCRREWSASRSATSDM